MKDDALISQLLQDGHVTTGRITAWEEVAGLCAALDAIGREGSSALVKIDGGRANGFVYTVVVSGGKLGEAFFRKDGPDLGALLQEAISFYRSQVWDA